MLFSFRNIFYFLEKLVLAVLSIVQSQPTIIEEIKGSSLCITQAFFCYSCFGFEILTHKLRTYFASFLTLGIPDP